METLVLSNGFLLVLILGHFSIYPQPVGGVDNFDDSEVDVEDTDSCVELVLQHVEEVLRDQESTDRGDEHVGTDQALDYGRNPSLTAGALIGRERLGKLTRSRLGPM